MSGYSYEGRDSTGGLKEGFVKFETEAEARRHLKLRGFQEVKLREMSAPPPPLSTKKKALFGLVFLVVIILSLYAVDKLILGPPDMAEVFHDADQAVRIGDVKNCLPYFSNTYTRSELDKSERTLKRADVIRSLQRDRDKAKGDLRITRESEVVEEGWGDQPYSYYVLVKHRTNFGKKGHPGLVKVASTSKYLWRREFLRWRIHRLEMLEGKQVL